MEDASTGCLLTFALRLIEAWGCPTSVGRLDDQITLSNGEKINPGPVGELIPTILSGIMLISVWFRPAEDIVIQNPLVDRVVLFGRAKDQPGLLIEPSPHNAFDPTDEKALAEYRNKIW